MFLITVYGGSVAIIGAKQLNTWQHLYKNINVEKEIKKLDKTGVFNKMTANSVYKAINKHLEKRNNKAKMIS